MTFLIFNRVIGTGLASVSYHDGQCCLITALLSRIYATPSVILRASGSVGVALLMWLIGALIAAAGTMVYIELGTVSSHHFFQLSGPIYELGTSA